MKIIVFPILSFVLQIFLITFVLLSIKSFKFRKFQKNQAFLSNQPNQYFLFHLASCDCSMVIYTLPIFIILFIELLPLLKCYRYESCERQTNLPVFNFPLVNIYKLANSYRSLCWILCYLLLQGPRTQIDAFQMNFFSWLNDILISNQKVIIFEILRWGDLIRNT